MSFVSQSIVGLVATEHFYILRMEMFAWETRGRKVFRSLPKDLFPKTKVMAANQGLYNGFLAAGLVWSMFITDDPLWASRVASYFLGCVSVAGIYGGVTVGKKIFYVQAVPALCGLAAVQLGY